jgi:hypothetical protein|tara:strand:+ start:365 stop:496 length:132 start_codon:yes stop_codon:yes gene_type:complete
MSNVFMKRFGFVVKYIPCLSLKEIKEGSDNEDVLNFFIYSFVL